MEKNIDVRLESATKTCDGLLSQYAKRIDHIAVAVNNLQVAIDFYSGILGFKLIETRETKGTCTGMISAVLGAKDFTIVLIQGTESESQVSQYINKYGPGVQHIAIEVDGLEAVIDKLSEKGARFCTGIIQSQHMKQIFMKRDLISGVMVELIERSSNFGFEDGGVKSLFNQLEASGEF